jgi:hypothetical protein
MKNHLSMLGSIDAGATFSFGGIGGSWSGETRLGDCLTVRLVLQHILAKFLEEVGSNIRRNITRVGLASDELLPSLSTLTNDISGVPDFLLALCSLQLGLHLLLVLALSSESKLILRLSIWDLVDSEPLIGSPQKTRKVSLNILDIIELGSQWVVDINDNNLPVGLLLIQQSHDTEDLDLLDLTRVSDQLADLADVQWIVVTLGLGLRVDNVGVLPSLNSGQQL